ncbi:polysaccharide biosynthesis C-terminal domain-containing protein [soil metagenome]
MPKNPQRSHAGKLFNQTIIYGIGLVLNRFLGFLLIPLYTNYFSPADWGLYNLIFSIWLFLGVIYTLGLENSFVKFFIEEKSIEGKKEIFSSTIFVLTITSILFSILLFLNAESIISLFNFENKPAALKLFKLLTVLLIADNLNRIPLLSLRAQAKAKIYTYFTLFTLVINTALNFYFVIFLKLGIESILYSSIISTFISLAAGLIINKEFIRLSVSVKKTKALLAFGNKFIYAGIFLLMIDISDRFFLKYFFDESVVGIYSACYRLGTVMSLMISAYKFSWTPYFLNIQKEADNKNIISGIFTKFIFLGAFLFLAFSFLIEPVVKINFSGFYIIQQSYWAGLVIIPFILLAYFFSGLYSTLTVAPFFANKTGYLLINVIIGFAINTILNILLIPKYSYIGAALATLFTFVSITILLFFQTIRIYELIFEKRKILIITGVSVLLYLIFYIFKSINYSVIPQIIAALALLLIYILICRKYKIADFFKIPRNLLKESL